MLKEAYAAGYTHAMEKIAAGAFTKALISKGVNTPVNRANLARNLKDARNRGKAGLKQGPVATKISGGGTVTANLNRSGRGLAKGITSIGRGGGSPQIHSTRPDASKIVGGKVPYKASTRQETYRGSGGTRQTAPGGARMADMRAAQRQAASNPATAKQMNQTVPTDRQLANRRNMEAKRQAKATEAPKQTQQGAPQGLPPPPPPGGPGQADDSLNISGMLGQPGSFRRNATMIGGGVVGGTGIAAMANAGTSPGMMPPMNYAQPYPPQYYPRRGYGY